MLSIKDIYCSGRKELAEHLLNTLGRSPEAAEVVRCLLWTPAWCEADGMPRFFFPPAQYRHRFDCIGFEQRPIAMEAIQRQYLRVQVSTCWVLPLDAHPSFDSYLDSLSHGSRKKCRQLQKRYADEHIEFVRMTSEADLEDLLNILLARWPKSAWGRELRAPTFRLYKELQNMGVDRGFLLRDASGRAIAGSFGYLIDNTYNGMWLLRLRGALDDLSTGFYHTAQLIRTLIEEKSTCYIMGPGDYDRKKTFGAFPLPIYRYETFSWRNPKGLLKLCVRSWKEKRKHLQADDHADKC